MFSIYFLAHRDAVREREETISSSTSSSAVQQENSPIEPAGALRCSHPGRVLLQDRDAQESERMPVPPGKDEHQLVLSAAGGLAPRASRRATLFAPGAGAPTKTITPGRGELKPVPPGRDEHQLVRDAAGELTHRASRRTTLFAPGAGAPTKTITPGRGELKPVPPGKDEHQLVRSAAGELTHRASRRATLFAPGAGAPTKTRTTGRASSSRPIPDRGLDVPPGV